MQPSPVVANSTPPLLTVQEATVLSLRLGPRPGNRKLNTKCSRPRRDLLGFSVQLADQSDCPGFLGMIGRACEDAALRRRNGLRPRPAALDLVLLDSPLFDLQPKAGDVRPKLFFLSASGLFKASVL